MLEKDQLRKSRWDIVCLGDLVDNVNEFWSPDNKTTLRYIAGEHIDEGNLRVSRYGLTSDDLVPPTFNRLFKAADVLFHSRNIRKLAQPDFNGLTGEKLFILRTRDEGRLLQRFLPFLLQSKHFGEYVEQRWAGSTNKFLNKTPLMAYEFALPPLDEQRRILNLLSAVESGLETLEDAKATGEKLFDAALLDTFKKLPSAKLKRVKECYTIQLGKMSSEKARFGENQKAYIKNNNVLWGRFDFAELPEMSFDTREIKKYSLCYGDLLVCEGGEIGRAAIWRDAIPGMLYQKALHRLRPKSENDIPEFMFHYLRYCAKRGILEGVATGTTIRHLPVEQLSALKLPFPARQDQKDIAQSLTAITDAIERIGKRLFELKNVKIQILLDAITGEP